MSAPGKIQSMSYDSASQRLTVSFDSNRIFVFHDVPDSIRQSLQDASDPDHALSDCVVGKYTWTQLRTAEKNVTSTTFAILRRPHN